MISTLGRVYEQRGQVYVLTSRPAVDNLSDEVTVQWHDSRLRSNEQIRKAFALMAEIGAHVGESDREVYEEQRMLFSMKMIDDLNGMMFHLSSATVSEASAFINFLVELIIEHGIETHEPLYKMCEDIRRYVYASLVNKKCAVCGRKADIHHCEGSAVGMGRNRNEMIHVGLELMPLCREHHQECHNIGQKVFNEKYHLVGIIADEMICRKVGLKYAS